MIRFERVSKRYEGGVRALQDVSFALDAGEMAFLTGHSGAGKSTLLRLILMLERPSGGAITLNGRDLCATPSRHAARVRRQIGMIFQDHKLLQDKTVFDNVALPLLIAGMHYQDIRKRVRAALDMVGLLSREKSPPMALSVGEQQRVSVARALANNRGHAPADSGRRADRKPRSRPVAWTIRPLSAAQRAGHFRADCQP